MTEFLDKSRDRPGQNDRERSRDRSTSGLTRGPGDHQMEMADRLDDGREPGPETVAQRPIATGTVGAVVARSAGQMWLLASLGLHIVFLPSIAATSGGPDFSGDRNVGMVELTAEEQARLPDIPLDPSQVAGAGTGDIGLPVLPDVGDTTSMNAIPRLGLDQLPSGSGQRIIVPGQGLPSPGADRPSSNSDRAWYNWRNRMAQADRAVGSNSQSVNQNYGDNRAYDRTYSQDDPADSSDRRQGSNRDPRQPLPRPRKTLTVDSTPDSTPSPSGSPSPGRSTSPSPSASPTTRPTGSPTAKPSSQASPTPSSGPSPTPSPAPTSDRPHGGRDRPGPTSSGSPTPQPGQMIASVPPLVFQANAVTPIARLQNWQRLQDPRPLSGNFWGKVIAANRMPSFDPTKPGAELQALRLDVPYCRLPTAPHRTQVAVLVGPKRQATPRQAPQILSSSGYEALDLLAVAAIARHRDQSPTAQLSQEDGYGIVIFGVDWTQPKGDRCGPS